MRRWATLGLVSAMAAWGVACDGGRPVAESTIFSFAEAVQNEDVDALFCALAGAVPPTEDADEVASRRSVFEAWARSRYDAYLVGRDLGEVDLADDGIVLVKAFALAKGAYYEVLDARRSGDTLAAHARIRFAYGDIDISGFPPGTTFYACGMPPGRVERLKIPFRGGTVEAEVLDTIVVRWTFERQPAAGPCDERWAVASAVALPESATTREIAWVF